MGNKPIEQEDEDENKNKFRGGSSETVKKTVSAADPDCGMFVKGGHKRLFAYEAHTACDGRGVVLDVEVTAGNMHDSIAWNILYDDAIHKHKVQFVAMDAGYRISWIAKKMPDDGKIPVLSYTRGSQDRYKTLGI